MAIRIKKFKKTTEEAKTDLEKLRESLVHSSTLNRNLEIIFTSFLIYVAVIIGSTDDLQLLLPNSKLSLPILGVQLPVIGFYLIVSGVIVALHFNILINLLEHSKKLYKYWDLVNNNNAEIPPVLFNYLVKYPKNSITYKLIYGAFYMSFFFAPLFVLLWLQIRFSDYQSIGYTFIHFVFFICDVCLLAIFYYQTLDTKNYTTNNSSWGLVPRKGALVKIPLLFFSRLNIKIVEIFVLLGLFNLLFIFCLNFLPLAFLNYPIDMIPHLEVKSKLLVQNPPSDFLLGKYYDKDTTLFKAYLEQADGVSLSERNLNYANFFQARIYKVDLSDAQLQGANLDSVQLQGADLNSAQLQGAKLEGADLSKAQLEGTDLSEAELQGVNLRGAELQGVNLRGAELQGVNLRGAELQGVNLRGAELQGADLRGAKLEGADLQGADLRGAKLQGTDLRRAQLQEAYISFKTQLEGADLSEAELQGVNLRGAELQGVNLRGAQLQGADLSEVELQGVNLKDVKLQGANLQFAELQGADLSEVELQGTDLSFSKLQLADLSYSKLQGADLREAELQWADLVGAQLQGANLKFAQLQWANLQFAELQGADLSEANFFGVSVFKTILEKSYYTNLVFEPLSDYSFQIILSQLKMNEGSKKDYLERLMEFDDHPVKEKISSDLEGFMAFRKKMLFEQKFEYPERLLDTSFSINSTLMSKLNELRKLYEDSTGIKLEIP